MTAPTRARPRALAVLGALLATASIAACAPGAAQTASSSAPASARAYFPPRGDAWEQRRAADVGLDSARLDSAVRFALASEIPWERDMRAQIARNVARERWPAILGPVADRGGPAGLVIRNGYVVAEWGDTRRVDMTFSVAKSYLATVAGLAFDRGLIRDLDEPVGRLVRDGGFDSPHNARITWRHLLTQTSEWEGTLWGKPDSADRRAGVERTLKAPGEFWEYNDVRVNRTALALLRVWNRPLPEVLKEMVMDPIGASGTWVWHGYDNSWIELGGRRVQSVSGGGHWGGGVWASTRDHARFGYLMLRRGEWEGRRILSERWIDLATTPTPIRPVYGFMWWLNTDGAQYKSATPRSYFALGAGGNVIWIAPELDLVAVTRWMDTRRIDQFMGLVVAAAGGAPATTPR